MTRVTRMSLAFSISAFSMSCSHGPSLRMMNERAEYADDAPESSELNLEASKALGEEGDLASEPAPRIAQVWVYPQRLSRSEYFRGAWISLRVDGDDLDLDPNEQARAENDPVSSKSIRLKKKK